MSDAPVVLRRYLNEFEARLDATILEANGIPAHVLADTAGGTLPGMALIFPVRLLVRAEDAALAGEILDTSAADDAPADDAPADAGPA
ncbi:DUF2007 domain-containing protein [Roseisolibacter sp. H3M3-2]|uniref:putative signal transducing protein n=1 Tax=Roseisolibacter sp. H3M3-2 TaxID=3031323 RepID=UPI0023DCB981|nr:DUF2007 domain-containing protein [Roseisolibacter sp. H3M3-2]MDF1504657.1 DUF2007 domain-containing protein [Roseisolibacter sp. H3M3-2]